MNLQEMNKELLEEVTSLRNQNLNLSKKNKELRKQLTIPIVSNMLTVKEVLDILDDSDHLDDAKTLIRETVS
jgi:hypothetical protein